MYHKKIFLFFVNCIFLEKIAIWAYPIFYYGRVWFVSSLSLAWPEIVPGSEEWLFGCCHRKSTRPSPCLHISCLQLSLCFFSHQLLKWELVSRYPRFNFASPPTTTPPHWLLHPPTKNQINLPDPPFIFSCFLWQVLIQSNHINIR